MNLLLIRTNYPPISIRPQDRPTYVAALLAAQAGHGTQAFDLLLHERLDATLDEYLTAARQALPLPTPPT